MRLPRLEIPAFLQALLKSFEINLPNPYYMVKDGFIYFSESPETLSLIHSSISNGNKISKNENWQTVSINQKNNTTISLFYDLARSIPFFLRGENYLSKILQLYTIGRCDFRIENSVLKCQLQANSKRAGNLKEIPGYSITLEGNSDYKIFIENAKNPNHIFWIEDENKIKTMNISSLLITEKKFNSTKINICPTKSESTLGGILWVTTSEGEVYLLDKNLEVVENFPVILSGIPSGFSSATNDGVVIPLEKKLSFVSSDGSEKIIELDIAGSIKSNPTVLNKNVAIYDKSFAGKIFILEDDICLNKDRPFAVSGIAFGSPALMKIKSVLYTGFINQAGNLFVWSDNILKKEFPKKLNGIFYSNVVSNGKYFFAVSSVGEIFRIDPVFKPAKPTNMEVKWTSYDTKIATVNALGEVEGISRGSTVITCESVDGGFRSFCLVTVVNPDIVITVSPDNYRLGYGKSFTLEAKVLNKGKEVDNAEWVKLDEALDAIKEWLNA